MSESKKHIGAWETSGSYAKGGGTPYNGLAEMGIFSLVEVY